MTKIEPHDDDKFFDAIENKPDDDLYRVLTIDLDYICEPYIELYSNITNEMLVDKQWDVVFSDKKYTSNNFDINPDNLLYCIDVFSRALKNCSNVAFGMTHDSILYELEGQTNINLFNIDHHHDVVYHPELEKDLMYDIVYESDWVEYLNRHERIANYVWVRNENSAGLYAPHQCLDWSSFFKNEVPAPLYNDLIFVCLSPTYTPKFHWFYFRIFINLYKAFYPEQEIRLHDKPYKLNPIANPMRGNEKFLQEITKNDDR